MSGEEKPKIIIDEDWKSRVQAEKEKAAKQAASTAAPAEPPPEAKPKPAANEEPLEDIPPASFPLLVQTLATPAMMDIEEAAGAQERKENAAAPLARAKHFIDLLGVLEEKTKGNLAPDEARWMSGLLHQLRMFYVQASRGG